MKNIIKKILKEDRRQMYINKIIHVMKNDFPLFKNMRDYGFYEELSEDELIYVLSVIFGQKEPVIVKGNNIYNNDGIGIYSEYYNGKWWKKEYDSNDNGIYYENSEGFWWKREYRYKTNIVSYYEDSNGVIKGKRNI